MKLIEISLRNSTAVVVGIILTLLFGFLAFTRIPIQLNPSIESPYITVETIYPGASAIEVEQEVTQRMEEKLAAVENLREMRSTSSEGRSEIILKFDWGVNKDNAQLDVLQKRNLVEDLPDDVEEPQILTVNRREQLTVMWLFLDSETLDVNQMRQIADDVIVPQISRIPDVANIRIGGGAEREIHVLVDLAAIAARDLTLDEI
ncbi:MAG: efflux RND transporter permease subunit, partial [Candidatus Omnitrophica bacterium]|nr:efflux RND transporter permease subunit [Candidatus Omnitrophota bacterium]